MCTEVIQYGLLEPKLEMSHFGMGKQTEKDQQARLEEMLNNLNRQQLLQAMYGSNSAPNRSEENVGINEPMSLETELARARLRAHQALVQATYANLDTNTSNAAGHSANSFQIEAYRPPSSLPLHLPQAPSTQPLPSLLGLTGRARYGAQVPNRNSNPFSSAGTGQVCGYLGAREALRGLERETEGFSSSFTSRQSTAKPFFKGETTKEQDKTGIPKLSESEKNEHFPLPAKLTNNTNRADYTPPMILSNAEFRQKWKLIERQLAKKKAAGKISQEAIDKIQRELFARAIQKGDMSHMYRRIHGIRTRSDEYGHLSNRPRYARKES